MTGSNILNGRLFGSVTPRTRQPTLRPNLDRRQRFASTRPANHENQGLTQRGIAMRRELLWRDRVTGRVLSSALTDPHW